MKTVTEKVGRYLPFPKIPRKAPTKMAGAFSNARWSALRPMGPAYGRDPRDAPSLSLRLPGNAPQGRVSSASAHTGPARRTAALDGFQKSPSLRRGRRAGPLAPGHRAPSCDAPHGSRLLGVGSTGAHLPGLALLWQLARSVQARYGFRCTESSCHLRRGGEPLRGRSRLRARKEGRDACCVPAQALSPLAPSDSPATRAPAPRTPASPPLSRAL